MAEKTGKRKRAGQRSGAGEPATKEKLLDMAGRDLAEYGALTVRTLEAVREAGLRYEAGKLLSLEELAKQGLKNKGEYPETYRLSLGEAVSRGEPERFYASYAQDGYCRLGMDSDIYFRLRQGGELTPGCLGGLLTEFGPDRVGWILAHTIQENRDSPEISQENKEWAAAFHVPRNDPLGGSLWLQCVLHIPPAALEAAAGMVREGRARQEGRQENLSLPQKPSILEQLAARTPLDQNGIPAKMVAEKQERQAGRPARTKTDREVR